MGTKRARRTTLTMAEKILIVDDDNTVRTEISDVLEHEGYEVAEACDGAEAVELLESRHFDLVITDFAMRRMNGLALIERLNSRVPKPPVILISGYASTATGKALVKGRAEFLRKPFEVETLTSTVKRLLRVASLCKSAKVSSGTH
jgi:DNA-binding NtrC family response regulator